MTHRNMGYLALVAFAAGASGCYTTTVRSGRPPAPAAAKYDEKWHHGVVHGLAELSGPYDLSEACPNGWAEVTTETSFLNGLVDGITYGIYSPQTVTIRCAVSDKPTASSAVTPQVSRSETDAKADSKPEL